MIDNFLFGILQNATFASDRFTVVMEEFEVYRPAQSTGRLEGTYFMQSSDVWKPSLSYKHSIHDIRNQFTPAENYRHALATSGRHIRMIQRLELRWSHKFGAFVSAAIRIQALYRGIVSRLYYASVKSELYSVKRKREARLAASSFFKENNFLEAISEVNKHIPISYYMLSLKTKCQYRLGLFNDCISSTKQLVGKFKATCVSV